MIAHLGLFRLGGGHIFLPEDLSIRALEAEDMALQRAHVTAWRTRHRVSGVASEVNPVAEDDGAGAAGTGQGRFPGEVLVRAPGDRHPAGLRDALVERSVGPAVGSANLLHRVPLGDRLLLLGFLGDKADFGAEDVNEVVSEMQEESKPPDSRIRQPVQWASSPADALGMPELLDVESTRIQVTPGLAEALSSQIDTLGLEQYDGRLRRLERSVLRLERINLESLVMLKKLVLAAGTRPQESGL